VSLFLLRFVTKFIFPRSHKKDNNVNLWSLFCFHLFSYPWHVVEEVGVDAGKTGPAPGVNFINVLRAAFAPVDLRPTYWHTAQRVQRRSWADFLVLWTRRVGRRFVG